MNAIMSLSSNTLGAIRNVSYMTLGAMGTVFVMGQLAKPSSTQSMASSVRRELNELNAHVDQDMTYAFERLGESLERVVAYKYTDTRN